MNNTRTGARGYDAGFCAMLDRTWQVPQVRVYGIGIALPAAVSAAV